MENKILELKKVYSFLGERFFSPFYFLLLVYRHLRFRILITRLLRELIIIKKKNF